MLGCPPSTAPCFVANSFLMNIVILAAGLGKRMRSPLPKVLHPVAGRPMLSHVLDTAAELAGSGGPGPVRTVIVVGHGAEQVRSAYSDRPDLQFVLQEPQLGTGHAVQQSLPLLADGVPTLVLYGDVPLVRAATLRSLVEAAGADVGVLTVRLPDPQGYGRVVRDWHGNVLRIVEQKDATRGRAPHRRGQHRHPGGADRQAARLARPPVQRQRPARVLPDGRRRACASPSACKSARCSPTIAAETLGVNSKTQLAQLERMAQARSAAALWRPACRSPTRRASTCAAR